MTSSFTHNETICLATLAYYKVLSSAPLVVSEVWQWQINDKGESTDISLYAIRQSLGTLLQKNIVREYNGFYSLVAHNQPSYIQRMQAITNTAHKWDVVRKRTRFLAYIPFVRYVRVIGSLSLATAHTESDIDMSIGTARNHLWTARALTLFVAHILRVRRHHTKSNNRLCFNHYISVSRARIQDNTHTTHLLSKTLFHITHQSLIVWSKDQETTLPRIRQPHSFFLYLKYVIERFLLQTTLSRVVERRLANIQIQHVKKYSLYSSDLPPLSPHTQHLVFSYQKIAHIEQQFHREMRSLSL